VILVTMRNNHRVLRSGRATLPAALALAALGSMLALSPVAAQAASAGAGRSPGPHWAPAASATVKPGASTVDIAGFRCVVGYFLTSGSTVYLTVPASCTGVSAGQPTNGCTEAQVPVGLNVPVTGARYPARLVYSSFIQMQLDGVRDADTCHNNDLALLRLDPRDVARANPSLPAVGGPVGVSRADTAFPDELTVVLSGAATKAAADATTNAGWAHTMLVAGPVSSTSVGAPTVTTDGKALGLVSYVPQMGAAGTSTTTDLYHELLFLRRHAGFRHVGLARGTEKFTPSAV
jgi:hypothetical protein